MIWLAIGIVAFCFFAITGYACIKISSDISKQEEYREMKKRKEEKEREMV